MGVIFNGISQLGNEHLAIIRVAGWPFFRGSITVEVYVSSIRTRAFGRYIEGGCCTGVTVMRGSTVYARASYKYALHVHVHTYMYIH